MHDLESILDGNSHKIPQPDYFYVDVVSEAEYEKMKRKWEASCYDNYDPHYDIELKYFPSWKVMQLKYVNEAINFSAIGMMIGMP